MGIKTVADLNEIIRPDINQFKSKYAQASKAKDYVSFSPIFNCIEYKNRDALTASRDLIRSYAAFSMYSNNIKLLRIIS